MTETRRKGAMVLCGAMMLGILCGCAGKQPKCAFAVEEKVTAQKDGNTLKFPYELPDSGLVVEELISYQGLFWEDKSGEAVENVAAIMLYNPTDRLIEFGSVHLKQADSTLSFFVYQLPPQSRCLIAEMERKNYPETGITACCTGPIRWDYPEFSREQVDYLGFGPRLTIINRDSRQQKHIAVWYKKYEKQKEYYLGGTAYCEHFHDLPSKERITVKSKYYDASDCRIVSIRLE